MSATSSRWWSRTARLQARDAAEAIAVDWEALPAVVDMEEAMRPGAPLVFDGAPGNVAYDTAIGDKAKTDAVFARRRAQVKHRDRQSARRRQLHGAALRASPNTMRPTGQFTLHLAARACTACRAASPA